MTMTSCPHHPTSRECCLQRELFRPRRLRLKQRRRRRTRTRTSSFVSRTEPIPGTTTGSISFSRDMNSAPAEPGANGGVWQATAGYPSTVEDISGVTGRGGYEAIQADNRGNLIIVEDVGGSTGTVNSHARRPSSFVYRFMPYNPLNLKQGGKLQALQVMSKAHSGPIVFGSGGADADIKSQDTKDLHTYGLVFQTNWVLIHDTATQGSTPFDANTLAKAAMATPFKRPENGQFRPGTNFTEFVFDETGDTNLLTEAGTTYGGFGALFRLRMSGETATLSLLFNGDPEHSSFDNCAFWDADHFVAVEDGGDLLHGQR